MFVAFFTAPVDWLSMANSVLDKNDYFGLIFFILLGLRIYYGHFFPWEKCKCCGKRFSEHE